MTARRFHPPAQGGWCSRAWGINPLENPYTKKQYILLYGDFQNIHREGLIAARQRAAQNGDARIEEATADLLTMINEQEGLKA